MATEYPIELRPGVYILDSIMGESLMLRDGVVYEEFYVDDAQGHQRLVQNERDIGTLHPHIQMMVRDIINF